MWVKVSDVEAYNLDRSEAVRVVAHHQREIGIVGRGEMVWVAGDVEKTDDPDARIYSVQSNFERQLTPSKSQTLSEAQAVFERICAALETNASFLDLNSSTEPPKGKSYPMIRQQ